MKKLITMIGAAAAAFGLYADTVDPALADLTESTIDFTDATSGAFEFGEDESGDLLWFLSGDAEGTIEAEETRGNYLKLDAEAPVYRTFAPINTELTTRVMDEVAIEDAEAERGGIIADQLVKFSAFEDNPADLGDAKIAVWVKTVQEEDGETPAVNHLMISTAALARNFGVTVTNIDTEVVVDVAQWHQLKITAIQAATVDGLAVPGFVVELDGVVIAKANELFPEFAGYTAQGAELIAAYKLFPSMIAYNATADAGTLRGVAFKGTGAVDDITVAAAPVYASSTTINVKLANGVTISSVGVGSFNGTAWTFPIGTTTGTITLAAPAGKLFSNGQSTMVISDYDLTNGDIDLSANTVEDAKAKIGSVLYLTLSDAVRASANGDKVELMANLSGAGIGLWESDQKSITIDLGGYTYTCTSPAVGSAGTVTQGFHVEPGNALVVTNGTITSSGAEVKMLFQNYVDLTLTGVKLDGSNLPGDKRYVLSNNSGDVVLKDCTIIAKAGDFAFDTCKYRSYEVPTVEVMGTTIITGNVELTGGSLTLTSGTLVGELVTEGIGDGVIAKAETFEAAAPAGYKWENGLLMVDEGGTEIKPGEEATDIEAETEEEALSKVTIKPVNADAEAAGQAAVITGKATQDTETGLWTVVPVINEMAPAFKAPDVALPATLAAIVADTDSEVEVALPADKVTPGLYYSIDVATDLGAAFVEGDRVLATGAGVTLPVTKPEGGKAFFKVSEHMAPTK